MKKQETILFGLLALLCGTALCSLRLTYNYYGNHPCFHASVICAPAVLALFALINATGSEKPWLRRWPCIAFMGLSTADLLIMQLFLSKFLRYDAIGPIAPIAGGITLLLLFAISPNREPWRSRGTAGLFGLALALQTGVLWLCSVAVLAV
jgi:hypothetical protein